MTESEMMAIDETNVMTEINVKLRCGMKTLYNTKVSLMIHSTVGLLKQKLCEMDSSLNEKLLVAVYLGNIMEDLRPIYWYKIFEDCTVHVFKQNQPEIKILPKLYKDSDLGKLGLAFRSLSLNSSYKCALMKITKTQMINELIMSFPDLNKDPVALAILQHPELLAKLNDSDLIKKIAENHPALTTAAIHIHIVVHEQVIKNHLTSDLLARALSAGSDEDTVEDLDDSSPGSEINTMARTSFSITAAQLASAIANVTTFPPQQQQQEPQPSTSRTNASNRNVLPSIDGPIGPPLNPDDYRYELGIMRDMGLNNEALNLQGIRLGGTLEYAIELVLSGFDILDTDDSAFD